MSSNPRKSTAKETPLRGSKKISNDSSAPLSRFSSLSSGTSQGGPTILHERDMRLGRATWNKYVLPTKEFPSILFKELFQMYPEFESYFMHMIDPMSTSNRDIFSSLRFHNHMFNRVMTKLKDIMDSLDKPEELNDIMTKLGLYHVKLGVTRRHLESMQRTIVNAVRVCMNKQMQLDEEDSLNKCLSYAFQIAIHAGEEWLENQRQVAPSQPGGQIAQKPSKILRASISKKNLIK